MAERAASTVKDRADNSYSWSGILTTDTGAPVVIRGGKYSFIGLGSFTGTASLALQYSPDGVTYVALPTPLTAAGIVTYEVADGFVKPVMGSGDGSTNVNAWLRPI